MILMDVASDNLISKLINQEDKTVDFVILSVSNFKDADLDKDGKLNKILLETVRVLKSGGVLFVHGIPRLLIDTAESLKDYLEFKYWFVFESELIDIKPLPTSHAGILLFVKKGKRQYIKRTRLPHQHCSACQRTLKDWGGKSHLMHPDGYSISDVIKDLPNANNYTVLTKQVYELLIEIIDFEQIQKDKGDDQITGIVGPTESMSWKSKGGDIKTPTLKKYIKPQEKPDLEVKWGNDVNELGSDNLNKIILGDVLVELSKIPDNSIDMVFADPPYNLAKNYVKYDDDLPSRNYLNWCNDWLYQYARIIKPTGSLFVLNLPIWAISHAHYLNRILYFQNWIVWDAMSEPRGKIMPAHYSLLHYTKKPDDFRFNYQAISPIDSRKYCLRASCIKKRKKMNDDEKVPVSDIWWDIHRIKHRRDRDFHPCQLPEKLMDRIIKMSTNKGDVVLDAFGGAGTTITSAYKHGRNYLAIDVDPVYTGIMSDKITQLKENGFVERESIERDSRSITKKELQLDLQRIAIKIGRLPTKNDVEKLSEYDLDIYIKTFTNWSKALKAAKLEINSDN